jgi:hypothetical protein
MSQRRPTDHPLGHRTNRPSNSAQIVTAVKTGDARFPRKAGRTGEAPRYSSRRQSGARPSHWERSRPLTSIRAIASLTRGGNARASVPPSPARSSGSPKLPPSSPTRSRPIKRLKVVGRRADAPAARRLGAASTLPGDTGSRRRARARPRAAARPALHAARALRLRALEARTPAAAGSGSPRASCRRRVPVVDHEVTLADVAVARLVARAVREGPVSHRADRSPLPDRLASRPGRPGRYGVAGRGARAGVAPP